MNMIEDLIRRSVESEYRLREAEIRERLIRHVQHAIENIDDTRKEYLPRIMAEAAVDALSDFYREGLQAETDCRLAATALPEVGGC